MNERVLNLFQLHQNPIIKISSIGKKYFLPHEEFLAVHAEAINKSLTNLHLILKSERVDRRNARSKAELIENADFAKIIKVAGLNLSHMGFRYDKRKCLNREEVLYLLETNRLEILQKRVPLTIQDCYNILLDSHLSLSRYRIYKKLTNDGFKLMAFKDWSLISNSENRATKKLKYDENPNHTEKYADDSTISNVFKRLQQNSPKECQKKISWNCELKMYYPTNLKKDLPDMDVFVQTDSHLNPECGFLDSKALFGLVTPNNIAFYTISKVKLPVL